ncbi:MAG: GvpL/GvpF family gas vesicle protein [Candidatus Korobacteraceae bacterium]
MRRSALARDLRRTARHLRASNDHKPSGDKMIMNAAFPIERERETAFDATVNRIAKKFGNRLNLDLLKAGVGGSTPSLATTFQSL